MSAYTYSVGSKRAKRWHGKFDVRLYRPQRGWRAEAVLVDLHPITYQPLKRSIWFIVETYEGDEL
jgi:hypothetical protein